MSHLTQEGYWLWWSKAQSWGTYPSDSYNFVSREHSAPPPKPGGHGRQQSTGGATLSRHQARLVASCLATQACPTARQGPREHSSQHALR